MNEKLTIEWLHRVLEEKIVDAKKIQDRIGIINHQIQYYKGMDERYQKQVIEELISDIKHYNCNCEVNWNTALEQLKEEREKINNE